MFVDNGFPLSLAAQLRRELTMCRFRIVTCKCYVNIELDPEDALFITRFVGPGLHEGQKSLHLDEVVADQSAELDFSG